MSLNAKASDAARFSSYVPCTFISVEANEHERPVEISVDEVRFSLRRRGSNLTHNVFPEVE